MKSAHGIACLAWFALLSTSAGAFVQTSAADDAPENPARAGVWSNEAKTAIGILRLLRNRERPSDAELAPKLAAAGERELDLLFRILATRSVPAVEPGTKAQTLSEFQENAGYTKDNFYKTIEKYGKVLDPQDVARVIAFVVSQPPHVHVNELVVRPTGQDYP